MYYDFVIIGGGSAGLTAAEFAVELGVRVAIIEQDRIGGDCTWTGCIPSKSLIAAARTVQTMREASKYGLKAVEPEVQLNDVMDQVRKVIDDIYQQESPEVLQKQGVDVFHGQASFIDSYTLTVDDREIISSSKFLIATGARPFVPEIKGLDEGDYYTYEDIWSLEVLPQEFLILGAGMVGMEFGQAFQRLGALVTIIEAKDRVLPELDQRAASVIREVLEQEGVRFVTGANLTQVQKNKEGFTLQVNDQKISGNVLLISAGRKPNVAGLNLKKAGVEYSESGIVVNQFLQTTQKHIYAAGDVTGGPQYTHVAGWQGFAGVRNALLPGSSAGLLDQPLFTSFTDPEVAQVGMTMEEAEMKFGKKVLRVDYPMTEVDRAHTDRSLSGYLEVRLLPNGKILGATIVGRRAGEMIHEWALAITQGLKIDQIAYTLHSYPTYGLANMQLAANIQTQRTLKGLPGKLIRWLAQF